LAGADLWQCRWLLVKAYGYALIAVSALVLLPWPLKLIIDHVLSGQPIPLVLAPIETFLYRQHWLTTQTDVIVALAIIYVLIAATATLCGAVEKKTNARIREQLVLNLRSKMLNHFQKLSVLQSNNHRSGDMVLRITGDVYALVRFLSRTVPQIFRYSIVAVFTLSAMFWLEPWLAFAGLVMVMILVLLVLYHGGQLRHTSRHKRAREGEVAGFTQEFVKGVATVQALTAEEHIKQRFEDINRTSLRAGLAETSAAVNMECNMQMINGFAVAVIMGAGATFVVAGQLTIGDLTVFVAYIVQLLKPVEKINELASAVSRGLSRAEMLVALLNQQPAVQDCRQARPIEPCRGFITFHSVSYAYSLHRDGEKVIDDVSFSLKPGQLTVLTGSSGSGKSTLINLILRQLNPASGSITIDGQDYTDITLSSLRSQFAVMLQHHHLFSGSLRNALWLNREQIDDALIWQALAKVDMQHLVKRLPDGLNTRLNEDGLNFSGGQRARLSLVRALLLDRPILILDEPLANIDVQSQQIIVDVLKQIRQFKTCLVVSHQTILINCADQLLRLEQGRLCQRPAQTSPANQAADFKLECGGV
ncbi:MAG TPA: ABC transporter ATP-binding protein, partial [Crenotrichaceae bacterium]|nr:ABC transporter ATP-binding protein [Crenotrichaceae bacterium]